MRWESKWRGRDVSWQSIQLITILESCYDTRQCFDDGETARLAIVIHTNETLQKAFGTTTTHIYIKCTKVEPRTKLNYVFVIFKTRIKIWILWRTRPWTILVKLEYYFMCEELDLEWF